jgi:hypothetical protein
VPAFYIELALAAKATRTRVSQILASRIIDCEVTPIHGRVEKASEEPDRKSFAAQESHTLSIKIALG